MSMASNEQLVSADTDCYRSQHSIQFSIECCDREGKGVAIVEAVLEKVISRDI